MVRFHRNRHARETVDLPVPSGEPLAFHRKLPDYSPAPLVEAPSAADRLGVEKILVKDESNRLGLPSFKILGASWAAYRALEERVGIRRDEWNGLEELRGLLGHLSPLVLVTATDGNHGRAVSRAASWFGLRSRIFVPAGTIAARIEAIVSEGAEVTVVDGDYDAAVTAAAAAAGEDALLIQDTAWPGYETVPRWIVEGYSTIVREVEEQLVRPGCPRPTLVVVQIGVGSLAAAVVGFYRARGRESVPRILGVEPEGAACAFESVRAGKRISIPGPHRSVMAGLNCGTVSSIALPLLMQGIDAFVVVDDEGAFEAMRLLAADGIASGESGSAGLAGLAGLHHLHTTSGQAADLLPLHESDTVLIISTEGITDPELYYRAVTG
jgi:diaminopropionate ammonia-lyase